MKMTVPSRPTTAPIAGDDMERLKERDLRAILAFLRAAYAQPDLDAFAHRVVQAVPGVVGAQRVSYNEGHPRRGTIRAIVRPADTYPWLNGRQYQEHPMMQHFIKTGDGRARKFSDFLNRDELRRTAMYQEYYRNVGVEYQMALFIKKDASVGAGTAIGELTMVNQNVQLGQDVTIGNSTVINQDSSVGDGSVIGASVIVDRGLTILESVVIGDATRIGQGSVICSGAQIGSSSTIGKNVLVDTGQVVPNGSVLAGQQVAPSPTSCSP